ncbi:MAG TPA: MBL fold metallo-hydrolase [Blastocatellia bacterium]|nr:MBL fold metallo-hydrolase [Blastocatellia bacterium]
MAPYIRQFLAGRDFARGDMVARQMANFVYLIGDSESKRCVLVDPAWDVDGLLEIVDREGWELTGALATHYHPDHIGGDIFGIQIRGLVDLIGKRPVKVHVHEKEAEGVMQVTGLSKSDMEQRKSGDVLEIGNGVKLEFLHTPGHTPGSQCFLLDSVLVSGDTLFLDGCGRVDLPGGNLEEMYFSLTRVLGKLPDETILYPGHHYSAEAFARMGDVKQRNWVMRIKDLSDWKRMHSG